MRSLTPKYKTNYFLEKILNSEQRIEKLLIKSPYAKVHKHQKSDNHLSIKFIKSYIREKIQEKYQNISQALTPIIPADTSHPMIRIKAKSIHHANPSISPNLSRHRNHSLPTTTSPSFPFKTPTRINIRDKSQSRIPKISLHRVHASPVKSVKFSPNPIIKSLP